MLSHSLACGVSYFPPHLKTYKPHVLCWIFPTLPRIHKLTLSLVFITKQPTGKSVDDCVCML